MTTPSYETATSILIEKHLAVRKLKLHKMYTADFIILVHTDTGTRFLAGFFFLFSLTNTIYYLQPIQSSIWQLVSGAYNPQFLGVSPLRFLKLLVNII